MSSTCVKSSVTLPTIWSSAEIRRLCNMSRLFKRFNNLDKQESFNMLGKFMVNLTTVNYGWLLFNTGSILVLLTVDHSANVARIVLVDQLLNLIFVKDLPKISLGLVNVGKDLFIFHEKFGKILTRKWQNIVGCLLNIYQIFGKVNQLTIKFHDTINPLPVEMKI